MKNILLITLTSLIFLGCKKQELKEKEALSILKKELSFPKTIDYDVFCSDPDQARKILSTDLEEKEWVIVHKTQKLKDSGRPLITFTKKAKPYLLPTPEEYKKLDIQKVKIAEVELDEIINIYYNEDLNLTEVEYTTRLQKVSPFSILVKVNINKKEYQKVYFSFSDQTWQLVKGKDIPFNYNK